MMIAFEAVRGMKSTALTDIKKHFAVHFAVADCFFLILALSGWMCEGEWTIPAGQDHHDIPSNS